jgi:hypothetical protein
MTHVVRRMPRLVWHALVFELAMYRNLLRWVFRRPSVGPDDEPVGYAQAVTPVMSLWIFASAAEMPLLHVLLPWRTAQLVAIGLGVWTLVWMFGLLAGLRTRPHLMSESGLRVRNGDFVDVALPWEAIVSVSTKQVDLPSSIRSLQPLETATGTDLRVGVSGRVNIAVQLRAPFEVPTRRGTFLAHQVSFWVDDPRQVAARIRERAEARAGA